MQDNTEQALVVWKENNKGEQAVGCSLNTNIKKKDTTIGEGSLLYSIKVIIQDRIVTHGKFTFIAYMAGAHNDQNGGFMMKNNRGTY